MTAIAPGITEAARVEWQRRVPTEYAVCSLAQDFARRLTQLGAPAHLIEQALVMALDELEHAVLAQGVLEAAGSPALVAFDPTSFKSYRAEDPLLDLTMMTVSNLCLGETLAVRVSHGLRANARVPVARGALERVVADEPSHAALGWQTLDWILGLPQVEEVAACIASNLGQWVSDYRDSFAGPNLLAHLVDLGEPDLAWGLATPDFHRETFERTLTGDWAPRLARRGFEVGLR